jgi:hypothetical protein
MKKEKWGKRKAEKIFLTADGHGLTQMDRERVYREGTKVAKERREISRTGLLRSFSV